MITVGPVLRRPRKCEAILRSLPRWFGIEDALQMYVADTETHPCFGHEVDGRLAAFLSLKRHFPQAWEVHCMAVHADWRNQGLGSSLLQLSERWLAAQGVRFLQVKTVADVVDDNYLGRSRCVS
jgi:GNAT superfamily N-acetyltransferase